MWASMNKTLTDGVGFGRLQSRREEQRQCVRLPSGVPTAPTELTSPVSLPTPEYKDGFIRPHTHLKPLSPETRSLPKGCL